MNTKDREKLIDAVEKVILLCEGSERNRSRLCQNDRRVDAISKGVNPTQFKSCEALLGSSEDLIIVTDDWGCFCDGDVDPRNLQRGWSGAFARMDKDKESGKEMLLLRMANWIPLKYVRGRGRLRTGILCNYSWVCINSEDDGFFGFSMPFEWTGKRWSCLGSTDEQAYFLASQAVCPQKGYAPEALEDISREIMQCAALYESHDLQWGIEVCSQSGFSIRFTCGIEAARKAFSDRAAEPSGRRAALRNWVSEHYRKVRTKNSGDEEESTKLAFVRQHLRGRVPFKWHGLDCNVLVAPFDIRRAALLNERRQLETTEV